MSQDDQDEQDEVLNSQRDLFQTTGLSSVRRDHLSQSQPEDIHSAWGGSGSSCWINCDLSNHLSEQMPDFGVGPEAHKGTAIHFAFAEANYSAEEAERFIGGVIAGHTITAEDFAEILLPALENQNRYFEARAINSQDVVSEIKVGPPNQSDVFATADFMHFGTDAVIGGDLKTGRVEHVDDTQIRVGHAYASTMPEFKEFYKPGVEIRTVINQPTSSDPIKEQTYTFEEHEVFKTEVFDRIARQKTTAPDALEPTLGKWCKNCRGSAICPAMEEIAHKALNIDVSKYATSPQRIGQLLGMAEALGPVIQNIKKLAFHQLNNGYEVEGYKLVRGRKRREWKDTNAAAEKLAEMGINEIYEQKLISPAKAEAAIKNSGGSLEEIDGLIEARVGGLSVAQSSDKRPAAQVDRESDNKNH